ncbi:MAG: radical SAM protein [Candidatus Aenigmarchaeota archaeon]|nr:radical SAM protein [Candidatus Aenigmarchaeota archaeon]
MVGEHVHWYIADRCNLDCVYCFKPKFTYNEAEGGNANLAHVLADSDVAKVTLGGGEPTLVKDLAEVTHILKQAGKYISLHTNGLLLDDILPELEVDDIALPIDSTDRDTQKELRGEKFLAVMDRLPHLASTILGRCVRLGYHTVFTAINHQDIPQVYDYVSQNEFDYWRIYEFNDDLASKSAIDAGGSQSELIARIQRIDRLRDGGTSARGYTDCLLAKFLLTEQRMKKLGDSRIQFVGRNDTPEPYAFLDSCGNISYYTWLSQGERRIVGNILSDGYQTIQKRLQEIHDRDWGFDDKTEDEFWWATVGNMPIWARLRDGSYSHEELEKVEAGFLDDVMVLSELHAKR